MGKAWAALGMGMATRQIRDRLSERPTFQSALAAYENGKVDFATVLEAQRQLRRAREDGVKARAEQWLRLADIRRLAGED